MDDDHAVLDALSLFWHPVCTLDELLAAESGVLPARLLGVEMAVALLPADGSVAEPTVVAMDDRCVHRSTRLSVGWAEPDGVRCAYHGWKWDGGGRCIDIPSMPDGPIPGRARVRAYRTEVRYGLVWVCLDEHSTATIPDSVAHGDPAMRIVAGVPYTWPVSALRRVENFVDLAHFAWVHVGTLGMRSQPVPPLPDIERVDGELRFTYDPPKDFDANGAAMYGWSRYRMPIPCTVSIEFEIGDSTRRALWMTASPIDLETCRCFWFMARTDDVDGPDDPHVEFQRIVLAQDEPVVTNQVPRALPLDPGDELSVRTDKVSIEYRRWLRELVAERIGVHA